VKDVTPCPAQTSFPVFWLRSALLYLGVTALIGGAIWLFWGNTIEGEWKKFTAANPQVKKAQTKAEKRAKEVVEKEIKAPKAAANATAEWNKAKSGATTLIELHANESRREIEASLAAHDRRTTEILRVLKIKGTATVSTETAPAVQPAKPEVTKPLKKAVPEKALKPMI